MPPAFIGHLARLNLLLGLLAGSAVHAASEAPRDWKASPAIVDIKATGDIYVLGDIHADYDRLVPLLVAAKLISAAPGKPEAAQWAGGKSVLVITGDTIDKYHEGLQVIALLRAIQSQAAEAGGRVIVTLGNHEAEFLASGGSDKKAAGFIKELKDARINPAQVAAGTDAAGIGQWLRTMPVAAKVDDWFFCHAGNTGGKKLAALKTELEQQITSNGFGAVILSDPNSILEARMHPRPWWNAVDAADLKLKNIEAEQKQLAHEKGKAAAKESAKLTKEEQSLKKDEGGEKKLKSLIEALDCKHMVVGHQPGKIDFGDGTSRAAGQIAGKFNGLFYMIDTGMSRGVASGRAGLLKIHIDGKSETVQMIGDDGKVEPVPQIK